jgi:hypothetical protein
MNSHAAIFLMSARHKHRAAAAQSLAFGEKKGEGLKNEAARRVAPAGWPRLAVGDVHRDFKAKAHVAGCGFFPFHAVSP